jgi:hypothetical protein
LAQELGECRSGTFSPPGAALPAPLGSADVNRIVDGFRLAWRRMTGL